MASAKGGPPVPTDDDFSVFVDVMREFMWQLPAHIETKLGLYKDETVPEHQYRLKVFVKC